MKKLIWHLAILLGTGVLYGQSVEVGVESVIGPAHTSVKGDLAGMVGFTELEITEDQLDTALANLNLNVPGWLRELYPGIRIEVDGPVHSKVTRTIPAVRFFARFGFIGGSFTISQPRLTEPLESKKLKNQIKAIRLSLAGDAEGLAEHLAAVSLADVDRVDPFFEKRYDLEGYLHLKRLFMGEDPLLEWGKKGSLDLEVTTGVRFTADPSPVVDLGSVLFISEKLDSLMEGGILTPVESTTDQIADALQNVLFGRFKDPRVVPSMGWFIRPIVPVRLVGNFSLVAGGEFSMNKHLSVKGTKPMYSFYGFIGFRINVFSTE